MKLAIMQPYFMPYIGYWQLINAVDKFVIYDDVNYIKQGWINRNRILVNGSDYVFNIRLKAASSFKKINEIMIEDDLIKLLKTIEQSYTKAPCFKTVFPVIKQICDFKDKNLALFIENSIRIIASYLTITTEIKLSSALSKDSNKKAQDKVINICNNEKTDIYINSIGGQELYSKDVFAANGIKLEFIKCNPITYPQLKNEFIPWLSIIDVMMFNSVDDIKKMLNNYELQ